jgi:hypothetical protein
MSLDQLAFIHCAQLSFFDDELSADDRVIRVDRLTKHDRGNGVVHACETNAIEIDGEEVRTLSTFQTTYIGSAYDLCPTARS